jgi:hypothetical protein
MRFEELARPIRTRGGVKAPAVRTRGAVTVSGGAPPGDGGPVNELFAKLRKKNAGIPLSLVILDSADQAGRRFLQSVEALLNGHDRIWLVPQNGTDGTEYPSAVTLDLTRDTDRRTCDGLLCEILFAGEYREGQIKAWSKRAAALVVPESSPELTALFAAGKAAGMDVLAARI